MVVALLLIIIVLLGVVVALFLLYVRKFAHDFSSIRNDISHLADNLVDKDL